MCLLSAKMSILDFIFIVSAITSAASTLDFPGLDILQPSVRVEDQAQATKDLIGRILGSRSSHFKVVIDRAIGPKNRDTFNILSDGQTVTISGTSGVAASMGFYHYLKTKCGCQFTWAGEQLKLPQELPVIKSPGLTVVANDRFRYYQNVCTVSYSSVWWGWARWQREIDWMAMNGFNLPLAFTGQEAIFQRVYRSMGFTAEDLNEHFGGPAFLAWSRMGNMEGWGGPLPQSWIDNQLVLQHKILGRMRSLGMIPVLPGFAGHVPRAITRLYPNATVSRLSDWGKFNDTYCCTYLLDFQDPLFQQIGTKFIQAMQDEWGTDHIYNCDSFNEMDPKSSDVTYLRNAGKAVYRAMTAADHDAIWLMQGWLFQSKFWYPPQAEALLTSVPQGKMIVLDLYAELLPIYTSTRSFYGQPFIWCMLHNFGGTMELYGIADSVNKGPFVGRNFPNSSMVGTGLTMEGIFQNEAIYELMNENAIATAPRNLTEWFTEFPTNRYGQYNEDVVQAWQLLKRSVYSCMDAHANGWVNVQPTRRPHLSSWDDATVWNCPDGHLNIANVLVVQPARLTLRQDGSVYNNTDGLRDHNGHVTPTYRPDIHVHKPDIWYQPVDLFKAWGLLVEASSTSLANSTLFRYDLVDVARNSLTVVAVQYYVEMVAAYQKKDAAMLQTAGTDLLKLMSDLEVLLASDPHFLLGTWIRDARENGVSPEEKDLMEYNARNQVTLWGPSGQIRDYAAKQWSGLMSNYYAPRWQAFYQCLLNCVHMGMKFNQSAYNIEVFNKIEKPFTLDKTPLPVSPTGDSIEIARELYRKYRPRMHSQFFNHLKHWSSLGYKKYVKEATEWTAGHWKSDRHMEL